LALSTWSLAKLAEFLVAEGMVDDISHEGLRELLKREEVTFQAVKTWKQSTDPDYEGKTNRVLELADIAELVEYHLFASARDDDTAHANLGHLVRKLELLAPRPLWRGVSWVVCDCCRC